MNIAGGWLTMAGTRVALAALAATTAALTATPVTLVAGSSPASARTVNSARRSRSLSGAPIRHVIEIMLENHTTDNLFPPAPGSPTGTLTPVAAPANEGDVQGGLDNSRRAERTAMDAVPGSGYQMDGYTKPPFGIQAITTFGPAFDPNLRYLARAYGRATRNFQPLIAPTQPNVLMALNGTAHGWYFNTPDPHPRPWHSIFDELTAHHRTWKIYYALPRRLLRGTVWDQIIPAGHARDLTTASRFFRDLTARHLPAFSFIRPGIGYSEEPREDIGQGDAWLGQLVNAIGHSRYWRFTAIFVTYDEGGGFWDHVPPTVASGYGTRTPLIIVSPWARHRAFRRTTTNVSILAFMQHLWHLPSLTRMNARQNDLAGAFNFSRRPLPRPHLPVAPADTIGFHGSTDLSEVYSPAVNQLLRIHLEAETGGLKLDSLVSGVVRLTLTPPAGVSVPSSFPQSATLTGGRVTLKVRFPAAGYYRLHARGPNGSLGWTTIVVR